MATAVANSVTALETSKTRVLVVGYVYRKPAAATLLRSPKTSHVSTHEEQLRQAGLDPDNLLQSLRAKRCLRFDKALVVPSTPPPRQEEIESSWVMDETKVETDEGSNPVNAMDL